MAATERILFDAIGAKSEELKCSVLAVNTAVDHIHIAVSMPPTLAIADWVKHIKGMSSREVNVALPNTAARFRWQDSYGVLTCGAKNLPFVLDYIARQKSIMHTAQPSLIWNKPMSLIRTHQPTHTPQSLQGFTGTSVDEGFEPSSARQLNASLPSFPRIVLILPCCIGDVVLATATLKALRRGYPDAHITWAVGRWSKAAVEHHDLLDAVLDTGADALPVRSVSGMMRFVRQLRAGRFDLAVSLVRSPLMSVALLLSGIPQRAGLDSAGRGFGYTVRAPINPHEPRHEGDIYLDVSRALGLDVSGCYANVPVHDADAQAVSTLLQSKGIRLPYIVINPAGGRNPGMVMDVKRWLPANVAALANRLSVRLGAQVVLIGGPGDQPLVDAVQAELDTPALELVNTLTFGQIAALARDAVLYVGNDTGLTHLAAAAGGKTAMILGPSDPKRYAPFAPNAIALWKPTRVTASGVSTGAPRDWEWHRDGISVDDVEAQILDFLNRT